MKKFSEFVYVTEAVDKRITTASVNAYLKKKGVQERLVKGKGYYYFDSGEAHLWYTSSVSVNHISQIPTVEKWYDQWKQLHDEHEAKRTDKDGPSNSKFTFKIKPKT